MKSPLAFAFLSLFFSVPAFAIVNGEVARPGSEIEKHTVMLNLGNSMCSGTILAPDIVITAAHCFEQRPSVVQVRFGVNSRAGQRETTGYRRHPGFSGIMNDMALVRFSGGLPSGYSPAPALDDHPGTIPKGVKILSAGYGDTGPRHGNIGTLRFADFEVMGTNGPVVFLRGYNGKSTCFGDSGGSAYIEHNGELLLFGVVNGSLGANGGCGATLYFSRMDSHVDWITRTIKELRR